MYMHLTSISTNKKSVSTWRREYVFAVCNVPFDSYLVQNIFENNVRDKHVE